MPRTRDFKKEYATRIVNATARGLSRSQARGHARSGEARVKAAKLKADDRLEAALKIFRKTGDRAAAARSVNIAPERFRRFLRENVQIEGRGRSVKIIDPRQRWMPVLTNGERKFMWLRDFDQASLNGKHMNAAHQFTETNEFDLLTPFEGRVVIDTKGKAHPLETDPNELHRLADQDEAPFHEMYRMTFQGE